MNSIPTPYDTQERTPLALVRIGNQIEFTQEEETLLSFDVDHDGTAQSVRYLYSKEIYYTKEVGWLHWNGRYWENDDTTVKRLVVETLRRRKAVAVKAQNDVLKSKSNADNPNISNIMALLQTLVAEKISNFDQEKDFLPVLNGIIDLRTGELLPHDPAKKFTCASDVFYDPTATCDEWNTFLHTSVEGGEEGVKSLQMWTGYSLTGHNNEEKMAYIWGPTRSGKGTYNETVKSLLPYPFSQEKDMNTFTAKRDEDTNNFDMASLRNCRMVQAAESQRYHSLNAATLKKMTGGNTISAAFKGKDLFQFPLFAK